MAKRGTRPTPVERAGPADSVDRIVDSWRTARTDLDVSPIEIVSRLGRIRTILDQSLDAVFATYGLTAASFAALASIARLEGDEGVSQVRLMRELNLTSGTISVRIDRLVADGLAERSEAVDDRRGTRVRLTPRGRQVFEVAAPAHLDNEQRLLASLGPDDQRTLANLLRTLLLDLEGDVEQDDATPETLGAILEPAHVTIAKRRAVGLPDVPGLLVRSVEPAGPAARAGMSAGDIVVGVAGHTVRSIVDVHRGIASSPSGRPVAIEVVRGPRTVGLSLDRRDADTPLR